tara:strand:- start:28 stop:501 length:474 start_codon:yes stop_codon:yes gene_type:complete
MNKIKTLILLFIPFICFSLKSQMTRNEVLNFATTLNWKVIESDYNTLVLVNEKWVYEKNVGPRVLFEFQFNGGQQSSKLIKAKELQFTKSRYIANKYYVEDGKAPKNMESRIVKSYKGESYCSCYLYFKDSSVRVTKHPVTINEKNEYVYYQEYEIY